MKESEHRDKWDVDAGATYIPWNNLPNNFTPFFQGGIIDEDTVPEHLKGKIFTTYCKMQKLLTKRVEFKNKYSKSCGSAS